MLLRTIIATGKFCAGQFKAENQQFGSPPRVVTYKANLERQIRRIGASTQRCDMPWKQERGPR